MLGASGGSRPSNRPIAKAKPRLEFSETLFVVPCCARKRWHGRASRGDGISVLESLPTPIAGELQRQRARNASKAQLDETSLLPALERFAGNLYEAAGAAFHTLLEEGAEILILSGGYGVVHVRELVGRYDQRLDKAMWPNDVIQRCLAAYAAEAGVKTVIGLFSRSGDYGQAFRTTRWPEVVERVYLVTPVSRSRSGAQATVPRATGEALAAIAGRQRLGANWTSSDGLHVNVTTLRSRKERQSHEDEVRRLVAALSDSTRAQAPSKFPINRQAAASPGLYSWWADARARKQLGQVLNLSMPRLIYVGQTGATQRRRKIRSRSTLERRIRAHLDGDASNSTFRLTLSAILREPLNLRVAEPGLLDSDSNRRVSVWIRDHLRVAIAPYDDRDSLEPVEEAVLTALDPPLNLEGMAFTPHRQRLKELRRRITHPSDQDYRI